VKNGDRDDGAPDDGYEERPRDHKAPAYQAGDHSDPDHDFNRTVEKRTVADGSFWPCHEVALMGNHHTRRITAEGILYRVGSLTIAVTAILRASRGDRATEELAFQVCAE
jgi:hypothetical protein